MCLRSISGNKRGAHAITNSGKKKASTKLSKHSTGVGSKDHVEQPGNAHKRSLKSKVNDKLGNINLMANPHMHENDVSFDFLPHKNQIPVI